MKRKIWEYGQGYSRPTHHSTSGYGGGYLLIGVLSFICIVSAAAGFSSLTGLPYLVCLFFALLVYATKMYFIRPQGQREETIIIGWDKMVYYLITALIFVALAAFGLYCLRHQESAVSAYQQPSSAATPAPGEGVKSITDHSLNPDESLSVLRRFIKETMRMKTYAIGCWFVPSVLELLTILLIFHNRARYDYWE